MTVRATRVRRLRVRRAIGRTLLIAAICAAGMVYLSIRRQGITLVVDGRPRAVPSMDGSVGQLLVVHGIAVDSSDEIVPGPSTALADGMTVTVDTDATTGPGVGVWVVEGAGRPAMLGVAAELAGSSTLGEASVGHSPIRAVSVVVRGKEHDVLTNAQSVGALLSAMGITPDGDDRVLPPPSTPLRDGRTVTFTKIRLVTRTVERAVPFDTRTIPTADLEPGESRIVRRGDAGVALEIYTLRIADGRTIGKKLERRRITDAPVTRLREVGPAQSDGAAEGVGASGGGVLGTQSGEATWYDPPWSGLTAAHPTLPFGTMVTVTNLGTGRSVTVRINDRGPFASGRIIDLSPEAFQLIAPLSQGVADVRISW